MDHHDANDDVDGDDDEDFEANSRQVLVETGHWGKSGASDPDIQTHISHSFLMMMMLIIKQLMTESVW